nr:MAG TPA: hypothetical protein [Caudoviricetes sp.]
MIFYSLPIITEPIKNSFHFNSPIFLLISSYEIMVSFGS